MAGINENVACVCSYMQYIFVGSNYNIILVFDKEPLVLVKTEMKHLVLIMSSYTFFFFFLAQAQIMFF